jgi:hypothetical protein
MRSLYAIHNLIFKDKQQVRIGLYSSEWKPTGQYSLFFVYYMKASMKIIVLVARSHFKPTGHSRFGLVRWLVANRRPTALVVSVPTCL